MNNSQMKAGLAKVAPLTEKMVDYVNSHSSLYAVKVSDVQMRIQGAKLKGSVDFYPSTGSVVNHSDAKILTKKMSLDSLIKVLS